ncbi:MAG: hypothetical protein QW166_01740 [Candidatus Bathyarchaeia archaeon]
MFFKQVKRHGDNFSYVIADETTKEAAVVDPSFNAEVITEILKKLQAEIYNKHSWPRRPHSEQQ